MCPPWLIDLTKVTFVQSIIHLTWKVMLITELEISISDPHIPVFLYSTLSSVVEPEPVKIRRLRAINYKLTFFEN